MGRDNPCHAVTLSHSHACPIIFLEDNNTYFKTRKNFDLMKTMYC